MHRVGQWSPSDDALCLWENCYEYKIAFYSLDGKLVNIYKPGNENLSLGVRCARWSPTGQILVAGDYGECITIFSYLTYKKLQEPFQHPQRLSSTKGYVILKEEECDMINQQQEEKE